MLLFELLLRIDPSLVLWTKTPEGVPWCASLGDELSSLSPGSSSDTGRGRGRPYERIIPPTSPHARLGVSSSPAGGKDIDVSIPVTVT